MRKYLNAEEFFKIIAELEINQSIIVYTENIEDNSVEEHEFMKIVFNKNDIILYNNYVDCVGIIQETPMMSMDDEIEAVYADLTWNDEHKVFIVKDEN